ncbi:suppressor of tub2 mutation [Claviceps sorghi]|nr:suppressor of tub2 mutation [Claviceps sorghi]
MADKLTDEQVAHLLTVLRGDSSIDSKVQLVTAIKSGIKQHNVPETCVPHLFDGLRAASSSPHAALVNAGFTALNHLLTRLSRQDPKLLAREAARTLPLIIDKLGDPKDKYRSLATGSLNTLYPVAPADVERFVRTSALTGKNPRAKEAGMHWLLTTHQERGLPFRGYVPLLMELLEDADGMVRDTAKTTVIELFRTAPNTAKSDLKRQLKNFKIRPAIEQAIVKALAPSGARPETPSDGLVSHSSQPAPPQLSQSSRPHLAASLPSQGAERPVTPAPAPDAQAEAVDPQYVNTNRELDDIFKDMTWYFEGRESEENWMKREQSINTLRKLNAGNAAADFHDVFVAGLRSMLDGIIKAVTSLRTSLSKEGCSLVQELAVSLGPAMDPMVELLMQTLVKLSAGTKKISSQMANVTVQRIISRVTYNQRLMHHIWSASQDKNVQPRTYATDWLKIVLQKEAGHKSHVEHTGGVDLMEKIIRKGLGDANPGVRERTRSAYWTFWGVWPARADA